MPSAHEKRYKGKMTFFLIVHCKCYENCQFLQTIFYLISSSFNSRFWFHTLKSSKFYENGIKTQPKKIFITQPLTVVCWMENVLKFNKHVAPNKALLEGKFLLELISVQHVYQEHQSSSILMVGFALSFTQGLFSNRC